MSDSGGWVGWGPEGPSVDLPPEVRNEILRRQAERDARRGRLVAQVTVEVYENGEAEPQVSFPPGSDLDRQAVAVVVRQARQALADWR